MMVAIKKTTRSIIRLIPIEISTMAAFAIAIAGVVFTGESISSAIVQPSPWLFAGAYGGPAALAFGLYWALARRL